MGAEQALAGGCKPRVARGSACAAWVRSVLWRFSANAGADQLDGHELADGRVASARPDWRPPAPPAQHRLRVSAGLASPRSQASRPSLEDESAENLALGVCSFGVFREQTKVRRPRSSLAHGIDRWENSGGRKGSTVWPADAPRLRCQYGKVTRDGRPPLKYHEYTFIHPQHEPSAPNTHLPPLMLQRHLYMVLPTAQSVAGSSHRTGGRKDHTAHKRSPVNGEANSATPSMTPPHQLDLHKETDPDKATVATIDKSELPALERAEACAHYGALTMDVVNALMVEVANKPDAVIGRGRPRLLGEKFCPIAIEIGPSCRRFRRFRRTEADKSPPRMDRWVNAGGKRAVVIAKSTLNGAPALQRRNGKILRPDLPELRYHQFNLGARTAGTVTVYHIFAPVGITTTTPSIDRAQKYIGNVTTEATFEDDGSEALTTSEATTSEDESEHPARRDTRLMQQNDSDQIAHRGLSKGEFVTQRAEERACERHLSQAAAKLAQQQLQQHLQQQEQQQQYHFQQQLMQQQYQYQVPASQWPRMRTVNIGQEPDKKRQRVGQLDDDAHESAGLLLGLLTESAERLPAASPQPQLLQPQLLHLPPQLQSAYARRSDMHVIPDGGARAPLIPIPPGASALAADDSTSEGVL